jgi:type VI secretion system protein ImpK
MLGNDGGGRGRDKTIIRPSPGGTGAPRPPESGAGAARAPVRAAAIPAALAGVRPSGPAPVHLAHAAPTAPEATVEEFVAHGANPILAAAGPLLSLGTTISASAFQADVEALRARAVEAVRTFEAQARQGGADPDQVRIARYIVCTFVDTAVFQTPWGGHSVWGARSLLVLFEKEAQGGEKFFAILEQLCKDPNRYLDLIELQYVCLALGFQGKYRGVTDGPTLLQALQDRLFRVIRDRRPGISAELAAHWKGLAEPKAAAWRVLPWWVVATAAAAIVIGTLIGLRVWLSDAAAPTARLLANRGVEIGYAPVAPPVTPSRLKALLAPQEQAGELKVEEFGKRTLITLLAPNMFRSGDARVTPGREALFAAIGRALEEVPGRIMIIGHTDDVPVSSFRFADNTELSRARAIAVAALLKPALSNPSRIQWSGVGSSQPRYQPASLPENRARNRRVEIEHFAD